MHAHISLMSNPTDITIVGGGLTGPTLALALANAGLTTTILDGLPRDTLVDAAFNGRSYALALAAQRLLHAIGIWDAVEDHAQPILDIRVSDGHAGAGPSPLALHFDHAEIEEGPMGYMVEDRYLRHALLDAVDATPEIQVMNGISVVGQTVGQRAQVHLDDGSMLDTHLIVGADGRQSGTAQRAGIWRNGWGYGQTALVCAIEHDLPHNCTAHQFFMPEGPLAILPLPGNRCSIVWTETAENAVAINALDDASYLEVLYPRFGDFLGEISLAGRRFTYPLGITIAERLVEDRIALVGDAAHGVHPIAGQGLNAGYRDIAALAEVIVDAHRRGEDFGSLLVLERYQQWRRFDVQTLALATDTFNRLFSNDNPILRMGRDIGLGIVNAIPGLRRGFIREAAGLTGDLPRLMQGRPL